MFFKVKHKRTKNSYYVVSTFIEFDKVKFVLYSCNYQKWSIDDADEYIPLELDDPKLGGNDGSLDTHIILTDDWRNNIVPCRGNETGNPYLPNGTTISTDPCYDSLGRQTNELEKSIRCDGDCKTSSKDNDIATSSIVLSDASHAVYPIKRRI